MKKRRIVYLVITLIFIILMLMILSRVDYANNIQISKAVGIILILYLIRVSYGCTTYIIRLYQKRKYSYAIIMNLGLLIFINVNIIRQLVLLIFNWRVTNLGDIYNNAIESFSFFALITLPCIIILSVYSIITNIVLIRKEGFTPRNLLSVFLGIFALLGIFGSQAVYLFTSKILLGSEKIIIKKLIDAIISASLSYFYSLIIATLYCNIKASHIIHSTIKILSLSWVLK